MLNDEEPVSTTPPGVSERITTGASAVASTSMRTARSR